MDVDRLHRRYTAYFILLLVFSVFSRLPFLDTGGWWLIVFAVLALVFAFAYVRFTLEHTGVSHLQFFMLRGVKGVVQILFCAVWVIFLLSSWFTNLLARVDALYLNMFIGSWSLVGLFLVFWLFRGSKSI
jgi:hypothetical protein